MRDLFSSRLIALLVAIVATWGLALNTGQPLIFNMAYLLSAVLVTSYLWALFSVRTVEINRFTRARRSQVGQMTEEAFEINNQGRLPKLWLELEDFSELPYHQCSQVVSGLRPRTRRRWQVRTFCQVRGRFRLGPMILRSGDPLGLFVVEHAIPATSSMVVYPATVDLPAFQPAVADLSGGEAISRRTHYVTTNVSTVREYAPGDSFNRIHWRSTARTGRLMTKEFELDPTADVWLFLDLSQGAEVGLPWRAQPPETGIFALTPGRRREVPLPPVTTEYIVTATASIARHFLARNRAVGLVSRGQTREIIQTDRGERQLSKILETLAVVEAKGHIPFGQLIATEAVRLSRNDTILAISADPDPSWARALREMRRRGVHSTAVVVDGRSFTPGPSYGNLFNELEVTGIPRYLLRRDQPIDHALSRQATVADLT
ncbi:MAG: DUF58 domain-containing protein [Caldilineaceae bacterium]|nr:DUF58 domain-containing protein [Caldilineaceae bacterium]MBP8110400.1 DUF58 domain-containing protein [Caldilineaceae bacterium]MBP8125480.1 DUF58 domain-containing protein [Caldilineaceae bacterium]MBP9074980.1 DUF58 domain-containing protein [Caldilineaceae bacterium]